MTNQQIDELIKKAVNTAYPSKLPYRPTPADYQIVRETLKMVRKYKNQWDWHDKEGNPMVVLGIPEKVWEALNQLARGK